MCVRGVCVCTFGSHVCLQARLTGKNMHLHPGVHVSGYTLPAFFVVYLFAYAWLALHTDYDSTRVCESAAAGPIQKRLYFQKIR